MFRNKRKFLQAYLKISCLLTQRKETEKPVLKLLMLNKHVKAESSETHLKSENVKL